MTSKIILFAATSGIVLATGASALPLNPLRGDNSVCQAHVVCDEYGRCWEVSDPGEAILHGLFGGSDHQRHDWDHHHHDWDHHHHHWDHHHWDHDHHSDDDD